MGTPDSSTQPRATGTIGQSSLTRYGKSAETYEFEDLAVHKMPLAPAREFITKHHYSRGCGNAAMTWGVYHEPTSKLLGVIAFQTPISENVRASIFELGCTAYPNDSIPSWNQCGCDHIDKRHGYRQHVTELHRLAIIDEAPQNTGSWFISRALKRLKFYKPKYWAVVSMADTTEGHVGTVYQASNADYYGMSAACKAYVDETGRLRTRRQCGVNISAETAERRGWTSVKRQTKHRYLFWLPDPYESKEAVRRRKSVELLAYPKVETEDVHSRKSDR